ncbi:MAG: helix-turn-helix transcriptional regulator [Rectinemataceae bacterium]
MPVMRPGKEPSLSVQSSTRGYSQQEKRFGSFIFAVAMVYSAVLVANDLRFPTASSVTAAVLAIRVLGILALGAILLRCSKRPEADLDFWFGLASLVTVAMDVSIGLLRPPAAIFSFLPSFMIITTLYFAVPTTAPMKIAASASLSLWHLAECVLIKRLPFEAILVVAITYLGINVIGIVNIILVRRLRAVESGYRERLVEELQKGHDPGSGPDEPAAPKAAEASSGGTALHAIANRIELMPLSPREREIAALLVEGKSRFSIGSELGISEETVKKHITHIYMKLGVNSRVELMRLAMGG